MIKKASPFIERRLTLVNEVGLHARPAAQFVKTSGRFKSTVRVLKNNSEADAKSITSILFLDAKKGDEITIRAEGEDAREAIEALAKLVNEF